VVVGEGSRTMGTRLPLLARGDGSSMVWVVDGVGTISTWWEGSVASSGAVHKLFWLF
jgi:hypothetical protein